MVCRSVESSLSTSRKSCRKLLHIATPPPLSRSRTSWRGAVIEIIRRAVGDIETDHVKKLFVTLTGGRTPVTLRAVKQCVARREPKLTANLVMRTMHPQKTRAKGTRQMRGRKTRRRRTQSKGHGKRRHVRTQRQVLGREPDAPALYPEVK